MSLLIPSTARGRRLPLHARKDIAFTLTEILFAIGILVTIVMLLFPAFNYAKRASKQAACLNNIRTFGVAVLTFAADNQGFPDQRPRPGEKAVINGRWNTWMVPNYLGKELFCPSSTPEDRKKPSGFRYAGNAALCGYFPTLRDIPAPTARIFLAAECYSGNDGFATHGHLNNTMRGSDSPNPNINYRAQYHGPSEKRGLNIFFLDGHAELISPRDNDWATARYSSVHNPDGYFFSVLDFGYLKDGKYPDLR